MIIEAWITVAVIAAAISLFVTERYPPDLVAVAAMVTLAVSGVLTPAEALAGFSNPATVTVAAMFVVSAAVLKTGVIETIGPLVSGHLKSRFKRTSATMMASVGAISAFVNNTPVVATFIPIVSSSARRAGLAPSRILIPLSFGAIFGGTCTLIGTSTNLLVSGIAQRNGEAGFSMFTLAPMGLVVFVVGIVYMLLLGHRLVPERPSGENLEQDFEVSDYLTEIEVPEGSGAVGMTLEELRGEARPVGGMEILQLLRDDDLIDRPRDDLQLRAGDRLAVRGDVDRIGNILDAEDFEVSENLQAERFKDEENVLLEVMLASDSDLEGHTLRDNGFSERWNCNVLAIRRSGELRHDDLLDTELQPGDVLLLHTTADGLNRIHELESQRSAPFITISEQRVETFRPRAFLGVAALLAAVVTLAATRILPISIGAPLAIVILMFSRFLGPREAYRAIDWRVVFLLAAALSFGRAMDASGLSGMVSGVLVDVVGSRWGPTAVVAALYLLTALCTEIMSNNAAAALLAPIALTLSGSMGVDPLPLLVTVAIAGSASFMTPVGYQTNTMVYSAGNYRFTDFTRVGAPLALALWLLATLLIPIFYPF